MQTKHVLAKWVFGYMNLQKKYWTNERSQAHGTKQEVNKGVSTTHKATVSFQETRTPTSQEGMEEDKETEQTATEAKQA